MCISCNFSNWRKSCVASPAHDAKGQLDRPTPHREDPRK
jgi:hypothetical protein